MSSSPLFRVDDLHVRSTDERTQVTTRAVLQGLDLTVEPGELHAVMGPTGSGTSTIGAALMGSPAFEVTSGTITFLGDDVTDWPVDERAKSGMLLGFGSLHEIPGVSVIQLLRRALSARLGVDMSVLDMRLATIDWMRRIGIDPSFVDRRLDDGLSPADTQRHEIIQLAILEPEFAILDRTGSVLDIDALRVVSQGLRAVRAARESIGVVLVTPHQHLLREVSPDHVHILLDGRIVERGGMELVEHVEQHGYDAFTSTVAV